MNARIKMFVAAVFCSGVICGAMAQVNITGGPVNITGSQVRIVGSGLGSATQLQLIARYMSLTTDKLPEHFSMVTSDKEPISVIITPEGAPVLLYTKQKSRNQIVVAMKKSDFSEFNDVDFSYQVTGVRDGFENSRVVINEIELDEPILERDPKTNEVQRRIDAMNKRRGDRADAKVVKMTEVEDEN